MLRSRLWRLREARRSNLPDLFFLIFPNRTFMRCTAIWCTGLVETHKKKPTANRKSEICSPTRFARLNRRTRKPLVCSPFRVFDPRLNPPYGRGESDLLFLTLAIQLRCLARPFIGNGLDAERGRPQRRRGPLGPSAEQIFRFAGSFGQILSPPQRLL